MDSYPRRVRLREMREVAATNRKRGASMERRVMKKLKGNRVPMSGAGTLKGDGFVYRSFGLFLVECKLSASLDGAGNPVIRIMAEWLEKLKRETKAMKARFGVLIFHFHGDQTDYVCMQKHDYVRYFGELPEEYASSFSSDKLGVKVVKTKMVKIRHTQLGHLTCRAGEYIILNIDRFLELLDTLYIEDES